MLLAVLIVITTNIITQVGCPCSAWEGHLVEIFTSPKTLIELQVSAFLKRYQGLFISLFLSGCIYYVTVSLWMAVLIVFLAEVTGSL